MKSEIKYETMVWLTILAKGHAPKIVSDLVMAGYGVSPLSPEGSVTLDSDISSIVALYITYYINVDKDPNSEEIIEPAKKLLDKFIKIIYENKVSFHSIILNTTVKKDYYNLSSFTQWNGGYFFKSEEEKQETK